MILFQEHWYKNTQSFQRLKLLTDQFFFSSCEHWSDYVGDYSSVTALFIKLGSPVNSSILDKFPNLKYILTPTTGVDHISKSLQVCNSIKIVSLRGEYKLLESITSTAEHSWSLLMKCARDYYNYSSLINNGVWSRDGLDIIQLRGKVLGIIGYGRLGKIIAKYGQAFGMQILFCDVKTIRSNETDITQVSHTQLYSQSDFIIISASYDPVNLSKNLFISLPELQQIKRTASIINISRGQLLDTQSALTRLINGNLRALALDVLDDDSNWNPNLRYEYLKHLSSIKNLYLSPHIGGYAKDAILDTRNFLLNSFLDFFCNEIHC